MAEISIKNFSCVKLANIELKRLNVIIGPQGAGKSVTTKLLYFFSDINQDAIRCAEDGFSYSEYKKRIEKNFAIWFPPSAWGGERFLINYVDKNLTVRVMRRTAGGQPVDEVTVKFSSDFEDAYNAAVKVFAEYKRKDFEKTKATDASFTHDSLEMAWRTRREVWLKFRKALGGDIISSQTFIPAGRAFFTSIGRLVAGIEHAGNLDPATLRFAKIFANWRDQLDTYFSHIGGMEDYRRNRNKIMRQLFGGVVLAKRDSEYIEMSDGRVVPFSSLSSGQQELLPIWYFLDNLMLQDSMAFYRSRKNSSERERQLIYIEEPEAHLFPEAQSMLLDILVEVVLRQETGRSLIITTHSPYIMSKLNVLLKAGQISRRKKKNKELGEIVERSRWLQMNDVAALKIENGVVGSIINESEELIDAVFLDEISNITAGQFSDLLDLEETI
ncbi:hypothetical protein GCM10027082_40680 [Comamonas humi]